MGKTLSDDLRRWYAGDLIARLNELSNQAQVYTLHFEFMRPKRFYVRDRGHLRKCLRTLEADGLVEKINLGFNIHQWKITEAGIDKVIENNLN